MQFLKKKNWLERIFLVITLLFQHFSRNISYKTPSNGTGTKKNTHTGRQVDSISDVHPCVGTKNFTLWSKEYGVKTYQQQNKVLNRRWRKCNHGVSQCQVVLPSYWRELAGQWRRWMWKCLCIQKREEIPTNALPLHSYTSNLPLVVFDLWVVQQRSAQWVPSGNHSREARLAAEVRNIRSKNVCGFWKYQSQYLLWGM